MFRHVSTSLPKELTVDLGGAKLEMVLIPAGEFLMGSPDTDKDAWDNEKPRHWVRISKPFYLGRCPVTQQQWEALMGNSPSYFEEPMPNNPVDGVSWDDCQQVLKRLNERLRQPHAVGDGEFRLPSEAQWEYACRAGSTTRYYFGDNESVLGEYAWYNANSGSMTHPVGEKKCNAWGLYDMHGNVSEWCQDWYDAGFYANSPGDDPTGPEAGSHRVFRGGYWLCNGKFCRSAARYDFWPGLRDSIVGFRFAKEVILHDRFAIS